MIVLLGGRGYVGNAFQRCFVRRGLAFKAISRAQTDYTRVGSLTELLRESGATFVINAAGYTGKPNVDACEDHRADCLLGNAVLPGIVREACEEVGVPWGHVSSGCIYSGRREDGAGFREDDSPNFSFRSGPCSFYSGSKALGEEVLEGAKRCYVWRLRIPFEARDSERNYLSKLLRYDRLLDAENSVSHLDDFVEAAVHGWRSGAPFGVYHLTNPGTVTARQVTDWMHEEGEQRQERGEANPFAQEFAFFDSEEEFLRVAAKTPRSNCVLDTTKAAEAGIVMRPVEEAMNEAIRMFPSPR